MMGAGDRLASGDVILIRERLVELAVCRRPTGDVVRIVVAEVDVHVAERLGKEELPDNVEVIDGGTAGLDVLLSQEPAYKLVIVDAIRAVKNPGTIYMTQLKLAEKERLTEIFGKVGQSNMSLHQVGLLDALKAAERLERMPEEITIIGVEPADVSLGLELTEPVKQSVPRVVNQVLEEIQDAVHRE